MNIESILLSMRSGSEQRPEAIEAFVRGVADESISRPQAAAWLAWAYMRGLSGAETLALTRAMTRSGEVLSWPEGAPLVDKHSTGGVGDKVSLVLAPLWASLGLRVPMISGRGLGHTGGTLDKLEAIPGYRCDLEEAHLIQQLAEVGCFISGQTRSLAPADRVLYGLRNETSTVDANPLIVGSILSKKLAEGVEHLVLDVKVGSGAFMKTPAQARALATALVEVAEGSGVRCAANLTAMDRPLGVAVGNAVEVEEAIACLRGEGPDELRELVLLLAGHPRAAEELDSGRPLERFARMVEAQGGDPRVVDDPSRLQGAGVEEELVRAPRAGVVGEVDALALGMAAFRLGAGRSRAEDPVDFGVGLRVHARPGQRVREGEPLLTLLHRGGRGLEVARAQVLAALRVGDVAPDVLPLVVDTVGDAGLSGIVAAS
ncbi:MAG: thymidine phosphorylase [Deltaproteobacteria bacterium]|nr:thymidine phosphorylase [Deltaproteobacteria bacterium]